MKPGVAEVGARVLDVQGINLLQDINERGVDLVVLEGPRAAAGRQEPGTGRIGG